MTKTLQQQIEQKEKERMLKESSPEAIKRIRLPHLGVSVAIAALGGDSDEVFTMRQAVRGGT